MDRAALSGGLAEPLMDANVDSRPQSHKHILFVSENFGTGHTKAAEALARGIKEADPGIHVELVELGRELRPQMSQALLVSYLGMINKAPGLWRKMYGRHHERAFPRWLQWCLHQMLYSSLSEYLGRFHPGVVVSTHPFASSGIGRLKREGHRLRLCTVITDFSAHGSWVHPEVDLYLVPADEVREQLMDLGVDPRRIAVTGIPTHSRFWKETDPSVARGRLGIRNMPTVLILGGGLGLGGTDQLARMSAKWKEQLQILVCTGRNRKLMETLSRNPDLNHPHIRITGFTDEIDEWMSAADVILTKPGGMTCTEAIAKGKPLLLYGSIPGHEEQNGRFMVANGLAAKVTSQEELDHWLSGLIHDPGCLASIREKMLEWRWKVHPSKSVQAVLSLMTPPSV